MTCHDAILLLEFARPGATELEAADIAALERHLAECKACSAFARVERESTERLAAAFSKTPASKLRPEQLRQQISKQRHHWQMLAAIKVAIVIGFGGAVWWAVPGPWLEPTSIIDTLQNQIANAGSAQVWLAAQDARFQFPPGFREGQLVSYEKREYHGTKAPILIFVHGNSMARVIVLKEKQFRNLPSISDGPVASTISASILILRDPNVPGVVYLVEVINGSIESFRQEASPAT